MSSSTAKRSLTASIVVGTLLIPISALAAIWLTDPAPVDESPPETSTSVQQVASLPLPQSDISGLADIQTACGQEGMALVDQEAAGTNSDIQQAALDALRPICAAQGLALPPAPSPEPIIQNIVVPATSVPATTSVTTDDGWDEDDDEYEHEEREREDHDDDHDREDDD